MYVLNGIKWGSSALGTPSGQITWNDELAGLNTVPGVDVDDLSDSLRTAFEAWENVAALDFFEFSGNSEIDIGHTSFSENYSDLPNYDDDIVGIAFWELPRGGGEPRDARLEFDSDELWTLSNDGDPNTVNFFVVALHEIGHLIGLGHPWDIGDPVSERDDSLIMNAILTADELGEGDKAGVQELYGLDGDDEPVEVEDDPEAEPEPSFSDSDGGGGGGGGGIILGLLALIFGLFTGGAGAVAAFAAGSVATDDDDHLDDDHDHDDEHDHEHQTLSTGEYYHVVYLPQIPAEDFPQIANAEGEGDVEDDLFLF